MGPPEWNCPLQKTREVVDVRRGQPHSNTPVRLILASRLVKKCLRCTWHPCQGYLAPGTSHHLVIMKYTKKPEE